MDAGAILDRLDKGPEFRFSGPVFETRDQIRAAALEEAARVCELREERYFTDNPKEACRSCAAAIRDLKEAR